MMGRTTVLGIGLVLLAGCSSTPEAPGETSGSPSASAATTGNGTVYTSAWDIEAGTRTITGYPIGADGSLSTPAVLLSGPADDTSFPGVVDGVGPLSLVGAFTDYWTTEVEVRSAGQVTSAVPASQWCGGEGLRYNVCTLLDATRMARTTDLGRDPETGDGPSEGSIILSDLTDGSTIAEFGPFPDLSMMIGTASPDELLIVTTPAQSAEDPSVPSTVQRLDLTAGTTTEVGVSTAGWVPLCPIGPDSVLGYTPSGSAWVVGPAQVVGVTWDQQESVVGCSADGQFLYLQRIPQPPTEEGEDNEPPNPSTALERISLADGTRAEVLVMDTGVLAGPIAR